MAKIIYKSGESMGLCVFMSEKEPIITNRGKIRIGEFKCHCGNVFTARISAVKYGNNKGCGCLMLNGMPPKHGHSCNRKQTKEYQTWAGMKDRCYNPKAEKYDRYGGRGIKVCERWLLSFENFFADMGKAPSKSHSLDRFPNNDGDYEPGNCRWATIEEQARNRSNNILITINGETLCAAEWARRYNTNQQTFVDRFKKNRLHKYTLIRK